MKSELVVSDTIDYELKTELGLKTESRGQNRLKTKGPKMQKL